MIYDLLLAFAMLQPIYTEQATALWGGQIVRVFNETGHGIEIARWPETETWIVTVGYRGKWHWMFRAW